MRDEIGNGVDGAQEIRTSAGAALFGRLGALGIDYVFANSGTDFPPIIEGLAIAEKRGLTQPKAVVMPHESAAMGMAHGYYLGSGRPQAVMVHTNVGLANASIGAINAACEQIPVLMIGGRTPTSEKGRFGARTVPIGWGQEMSDQTALVRGAVKWDYELRFPEQVESVVDRAHAIAASTPKGPVYLNLPREVLCEDVTIARTPARPLMQPASPVPSAAQIEEAADLLAEAKAPVIFAQRGAGGERGFGTLIELAEDWGIPVCQYWATQLAMPSNHPLSSDPNPAPLLAEADVILVLDALAPWSPKLAEPKPSARVIQIGPDPLQTRTPIRNFQSDLSLTGEVEPALVALKAAMDARLSGRKARNAARGEIHMRRNADARARRERTAQKGRAALTKEWVSRTVSDAIAGTGAAVFSELGLQLPYMDCDHPKSWYDGPLAGGLGWGFPAALGFKLAEPERPVIASMGDGSYIFANPVACHQIAEALGISVVVLVLNNAEWGAVRASVSGLYPHGAANTADTMPLTGLEPVPDFTRVAQASRAWTRKVTTADAFETAFEEALAHVAADRGLALLDVSVAKD